MPFSEMQGYPKIVKITNQLATKFAEMTPAKGDREEREWRRDEILRCIKEGTFRAPEWASAVCKEDGVEYRVNGKHTSKTLAEMNGSMPRIKVLLTKFECDTLHDVAELYNTYDKSTSARSARDNVRSFQMTHPELSLIPTRYVTLAVNGMAYEKWEGTYHPQDEKSQLMFEHLDFCQFVYEVCGGGKPGRWLARTGCVAAMFKTFQRSKADSKKFWLAVRDASGHPASVPDRKLNQWLITTIAGGGYVPAKGKKAAGQHEFLVRCIRAWNAWRKNEPTDLKYFVGCKTPAAV